MITYLRSLWHYRYFIATSIMTEFRSRFARSRFGALWMVFHPLAQVLIYALILSRIMKAKLPGIESQYAYPIYLLAGITAWTLFAEIVTRLLTTFIDNGNLLKKLAFPKLTLPLVSIGAAFVNFTLLLVSVYGVFFILGHHPHHTLVALIPLILLTMILGTGIGLTLGILNIFIRDIGQITGIVLQFWFWLTPIVYIPCIVPEKYRWILEVNPLTPLVESFHKVLVYDLPPRWQDLAYPIVFALATCSLAAWLFFKSKEEMTDVL